LTLGFAVARSLRRVLTPSWIRRTVPGAAVLAAGCPQTALWIGGSWVALILVLLLNTQGVVEALSGTGANRIAALVLLGGLAAVWAGALAFGRHLEESGLPRTPLGAARVRFGENPSAVLGVFVLTGIVWLVVLAPFIAPYDPLPPGDLSRRLSPPSSLHMLGTDALARDLWSRLLYGGRISLGVASLAVTLSLTLGAVVGGWSTLIGGRVERWTMAVVDLIRSVPRLVLLLVIAGAVGGPSIPVLVLVLAFTEWPRFARLVHVQVLSLREREYVMAAHALGLSSFRVLIRHVLPNMSGPMIAWAALGVGETILLEAGLSFLGLGVQEPRASWGVLVAAGQDNLLEAWWITTFSGLAIVLTVLTTNLIADGLESAMDAKVAGTT